MYYNRSAENFCIDKTNMNIIYKLFIDCTKRINKEDTIWKEKIRVL